MRGRGATEFHSLRSWPGHIEPGTESDSLISNVDLFATVADIVGRKLNSDAGPDSVSLLPVLEGDNTTEVRDHLLIAPAKPSNLSLRAGDWVYIDSQGGGGFSSPNVGDHGFGGPATQRFTQRVNSDIEDGRIRPNAPAQQLYNLKNDPHQTTNVITGYPDIARRMKAMMEKIRDVPVSRS